MDNVTHTLFALTLARTPLGRAGRGTTTALVVASNAPDVDAIALSRGAVSYLAWHRGPTHGLLGIVALGFLSAGAAWVARQYFDRSADNPRPDASFGMLVAVSAIGVLLHILMDLPTSYGTRILSPFSWSWFAFDWMPIVDVYLLAVLAAGLAFGEFSPASRRRLASIVLALVAVIYGIRATAHHQALTLAPRLFGPLLPQPCEPQAVSHVIESWPRPAAPVPVNGKSCLVEMAAIPTFTSPFRWRVVAHLTNGYELHEVDVLDQRLQAAPAPGEALWRRAVRYPNQWTPASFAAAATHTGQVYLGFSRFSAARSYVDPSGTATVRWADMRFAGGMLTFSGDRQSGDRLTAFVRIGPDGRVLEEGISQ